MKAVNLLPADARRGRTVVRPAGTGVSIDSLSVGHFAVGLCLVIVAIVLLRVLVGNEVANRQATLNAIRAQVQTEQAQASRLQSYVSFVADARQRESQVRAIADQRFDWQRTLNQLSRVLGPSTTLTSLAATTSAATGTATAATGAAPSGPTFTLSGCAETPNQNGVATLLRRLNALSGVENVGFDDSTRAASCGNSFGVTLSFAGPSDAGTTTTGGTTR